MHVSSAMLKAELYLSVRNIVLTKKVVIHLLYKTSQFTVQL